MIDINWNHFSRINILVWAFIFPKGEHHYRRFFSSWHRNVSAVSTSRKTFIPYIWSSIKKCQWERKWKNTKRMTERKRRRQVERNIQQIVVRFGPMYTKRWASISVIQFEFILFYFFFSSPTTPRSRLLLEWSSHLTVFHRNISILVLLFDVRAYEFLYFSFSFLSVNDWKKKNTNNIRWRHIRSRYFRSVFDKFKIEIIAKSYPDPISKRIRTSSSWKSMSD